MKPRNPVHEGPVAASLSSASYRSSPSIWTRRLTNDRPEISAEISCKAPPLPSFHALPVYRPHPARGAPTEGVSASGKPAEGSGRCCIRAGAEGRGPLACAMWAASICGRKQGKRGPKCAGSMTSAYSLVADQYDNSFIFLRFWGRLTVCPIMTIVGHTPREVYSGQNRHTGRPPGAQFCPVSSSPNGTQSAA
jgi:hypothetical protein